MLKREKIKILVIKLRALGDVLVSTPVLANLRDFYPDSEIYFLTDIENGEILLNNPHLNEVIILPKGWMREVRTLLDIRKKKFDIVFDLFGNPKSAWITLLSGAKIRAGFSYRIRKMAYNIKILPDNPKYVIDFLLDILEPFGITVKTREMVFPMSFENRKFALEFYNKENINAHETIIGLFPGGGWKSKRWEVEKFAELGDILIEEMGFRVIIFGGENDRRDVEKILSKMRQKPSVLIGARLHDFGAVVSNISLWVGNDSGPKYIAITLGVPTITIFGPTDSYNATPKDANHIALKSDVPCLVCNQLICPKKLPHEYMACMRKITVEEVFNNIKSQISNIKKNG